MKKSIKFFLIFGFVLLLIGIGTSFAALAMGAEFTGSNYQFHRLLRGERHPANLSSEGTDYTLFKTADITELDLEIGAGTVYFDVTDEVTDEIRVSVIKGTDSFDSELEDGKLKIEYLKYLKGVWEDDHMNNELLIQVPEGFQFRKAEFDLKAGLAEIHNLSAKKLEAEISAGGAEFYGGSVGELDLDVKTGGIRYEGAVSGDIKAECSTGGIELILEGEKEDFDYKVTGKVGFIKIDGETMVEFGGSTSKKNNASKIMDLECKTGGIEVKFE